MMKLTKIEDYPNQEMWDIEIEDSHCFFANGVLVHNSNAGVRFSKNGELVAQSRERDLSLLSDNHGFYAFVFKNEKFFRELAEFLIGESDQVVIYGEWFGKGINDNVAVNELTKRFVIFGIRFIEDEESFWYDTFGLDYWLNDFIDELNAHDVYVITQFGSWEIEIDFNRPEMIQNRLIEITNEVERECPVGKYFGVSSFNESNISFSIMNNKINCDKILPEKIKEKIMNLYDNNKLVENDVYIIQQS
jgi:hypothetical protein